MNPPYVIYDKHVRVYLVAAHAAMSKWPECVSWELIIEEVTS